MFETRLKILLFVATFALAIVVARLVDMQIVHAHVYRQQAEDALLQPEEVLPAVRGRILDRFGGELATEEPCWDVRIDFGVLAMDPDYVKARVARFKRQARYGKDRTDAEIEAEFRKEVESMWRVLADFSGEDLSALLDRAKDITDRIHRIREIVSRNRGFETAVREERMRHTVLGGLNDQRQITARELFHALPWVVVESSTERVYHVAEPFAHVLGRTGPVAAEDLESDPFADDPPRAYRGGESLGISGVERAAENVLRGRRGVFQNSLSGAVIANTAPQRGGDARLTIHRALQERLYAMFAEQSARLPDQPGGSIVVLDVLTRDCLALVSYPSFDPSRFQEDYSAWRRDTRRQPLRFRAVANRYAPGSIVKPLACLAGLNSGVIQPGTTFRCEGVLFPEHPDRWRCWADQAGRRMHHGLVSTADAIKHSCNIFMYKTGQLVGVNTLCTYFDLVGFGKPSGTGLSEEVSGINPTPSWLTSNTGQSITPGKARHFAIGQAELSVTPIQAANLMAVYASGKFRQVCLIDQLRDDTEWVLPGDAANWRAIRRGLYGVVNDHDGTAHRTAYLSPATGYAICGKTGSAEARPWPVSYAVPYVDTSGVEQVAILAANTRADAEADFMKFYPDMAFDRTDIHIHERLPLHALPPGRKHSHAWFAGYLQPLGAAGQPDWSRTPPIAFAVMVEFGGSGGRVSAPVAKQAAEILIEILGPGLDPDVPLAAVERGGR